DLDLQGGSVGLYLDLGSAVGVQECLADADQIDTTLVKSVMSRHKAGFDVLTAPETVVGEDDPATEAVQTLLDVLRDDYDAVIVDTPPGWTRWSKALLANCDAICLVTQLTVAGVRHARRRLDTLEMHGFGETPTLIAVNRYERRLIGHRVRAKDAERLLQ